MKLLTLLMTHLVHRSTVSIGLRLGQQRKRKDGGLAAPGEPGPDAIAAGGWWVGGVVGGGRWAVGGGRSPVGWLGCGWVVVVVAAVGGWVGYLERI